MDGVQHNPIDGDPARYPNRAPAMREYYLAWCAWCMATDVAVGAALEEKMADLQDEITLGGGPLWYSFIADLPGYVEFWNYFEEHFMGLEEDAN